MDTIDISIPEDCASATLSGIVWRDHRAVQIVPSALTQEIQMPGVLDTMEVSPAGDSIRLVPHDDGVRGGATRLRIVGDGIPLTINLTLGDATVASVSADPLSLAVDMGGAAPPVVVVSDPPPPADPAPVDPPVVDPA